MIAARILELAEHVSDAADCLPCGSRESLSKPTSEMAGSLRGFAGKADELVGTQIGFPRRTWQINSNNSEMHGQELRLAGKVTT